MRIRDPDAVFPAPQQPSSPSPAPQPAQPSRGHRESRSKIDRGDDGPRTTDAAKQLGRDLGDFGQHPNLKNAKKVGSSAAKLGDAVNPFMERDPVARASDLYQALRDIRPVNPDLGRFAMAGHGAGAVGGLLGAAALPGQLATASSDLRDWARHPTHDRWDKASKSTLRAARDDLYATQGALYTASGLSTDAQTYRAYRAAQKAFDAKVPGASPKVRNAAARSVAKDVFKGKDVVDDGPRSDREALSHAKIQRAMKANATDATLNEAKKAGGLRKAAGLSERAGAKAALRAGAASAVEAGAEAAGRSGALVGGRALGRFVPGVNDALAVVDTAIFAKTLTDPHASVGQKVTTGITAAGSILAATNVPVVSQVGAGISVASSFVGLFV